MGRRTVNDRKTRSVTKNHGFHIERIYAEDGVVKIQSTDGTKKHLPPGEAVIHLLGINNMLKKSPGGNEAPPDFRRRALEIIEQGVDAVRQARAQLHDPTSEGEIVVSNLFKGLTADGKVLQEVTDEDDIIHRMTIQYPMMKHEEIRVIYRSDLPEDMKTLMLVTVNSDRINEAIGSKALR